MNVSIVETAIILKRLGVFQSSVLVDALHQCVTPLLVLQFATIITYISGTPVSVPVLISHVSIRIG